jgi:hypothetical protein
LKSVQEVIDLALMGKRNHYDLLKERKINTVSIPLDKNMTQEYLNNR